MEDVVKMITPLILSEKDLSFFCRLIRQTEIVFQIPPGQLMAVYVGFSTKHVSPLLLTYKLCKSDAVAIGIYCLLKLTLFLEMHSLYVE